jgi:competence transcription factor ComK
MPATKKPRYYRMTPGSVTRYFYVETYYFKTVEDRETFFEWINTQSEGEINAVEMNGCSIMIRWNS